MAVEAWEDGADELWLKRTVRRCLPYSLSEQNILTCVVDKVRENDPSRVEGQIEGPGGREHTKAERI